MIARSQMPPEYVEFNRRWGAPSGSSVLRVRNRFGKTAPVLDSLLLKRVISTRGMFGFQDNNATRRFEYPWAFYAAELSPGMTAVDIGGSLAGFQFVLCKAGVDVINVDPGMSAHGKGWPVDQESIGRLNRAFGTNVRLENCFLEQAKIEPGSVDRVFSISTIEHIPEAELAPLMRRVYDILKPGGRFVATIDLFLNVAPFCDRPSNEYGGNISVANLIAAAPFTIVHGDRSELCGFPEFNPGKVLSKLEQYCYGTYPALVQTIVLEKGRN